ncbi:hypothetical protein ACOMHN_010135 [Nucella lapillus]
MLNPSSSDEESDNETLEEGDETNSEVRSLPSGASGEQKSLSASGDNLSVVGCGHSRSNSIRPCSPSPSLASDREKVSTEEVEKIEREEEERKRQKKRLQLYVFVMRCIAYPFNAKQPTDMARRQTKVTKQQLQIIKERYHAFLNGETHIVADEAFTNAVQSYYEVFLKSDRVANMVRSGGCSANDFREVFKNNIEKRVRCMPEIDGLRKETVLSSWMAKFDAIYRGEEDHRKQPQRMASAASELILSKEQLYDMFQNILDVKKYEHQILYNACQLDNADEQAAQVRRELDGRLQVVEEMIRLKTMLRQSLKKEMARGRTMRLVVSRSSMTRPQQNLKMRQHPKFVVKEMESMYMEDLRSSINLLKSNLESLPVSKGVTDSKYSLQRLKRYNR